MIEDACIYSSETYEKRYKGLGRGVGGGGIVDMEKNRVVSIRLQSYSDDRNFLYEQRETAFEISYGT